MTRTWPLVHQHLAQCPCLWVLFYRLLRINDKMFWFLVYKWIVSQEIQGLMIPCTYVWLARCLFHCSNIFQMLWDHHWCHSRKVRISIFLECTSILSFVQEPFSWLDGNQSIWVTLSWTQTIRNPGTAEFKSGPNCGYRIAHTQHQDFLSFVSGWALSNVPCLR